MNNWKDILNMKLIAIMALVFVFALSACSKTELNDVSQADEQVQLKSSVFITIGIGDNGGDDDQDKDDSIGDNGGDDDQDKDDTNRVKIIK
jgi:hypothetical protein